MPNPAMAQAIQAMPGDGAMAMTAGLKLEDWLIKLAPRRKCRPHAQQDNAAAVTPSCASSVPFHFPCIAFALEQAAAPTYPNPLATYKQKETA